MAFVSELFDQLRDLLNDSTDSQVTFAMKKLYLNLGIKRLWPKVFRVVNTSITVVTGTYDYTLPTAVGMSPMDSLVISVELERLDGSYIRFDDYDIISGDEDLAGIFRLTVNPDSVDLLGYDIRIRYAAPISAISAASYAAAGSETWTGPDRAMGIPVHYAAAMCAMRKVDDRQDTNRYSTTQAENGVTDQDMMALAQVWMGQFELELTEFERPLPPARD